VPIRLVVVAQYHKRSAVRNKASRVVTLGRVYKQDRDFVMATTWIGYKSIENRPNRHNR